jgi:hypothetical protein
MSTSMHSSAATSDPVEEEWTPGEDESVAVDITYCNPAATVILISSDKVEMRVDAWQMSRQRYICLVTNSSETDSLAILSEV